MAFDSLSAFLVMEGHGPYVWTCYGAFFLLMIGLVLWSVRRRNAVIHACQRGHESRAGRSGSGAEGAPTGSFARVHVSQDTKAGS